MKTSSLLVFLCVALGATAVRGQSTTPASSIVGVVAEEIGLPLVQPGQVPLNGTYWVVQNGGINGVMAVPYPCPTFDPTLPIYAITPDFQQFLVDGTGDDPLVSNPALVRQLGANYTPEAALVVEGAYLENLITPMQAAYASEHAPRMAMTFGFSSVGGFNDNGTNYGNSGGSPFTPPDYGTNLWLAITSTSNGVLSLILSNTIYTGNGDVYEVMTKPGMSAGWNIATEIWAVSNQNWIAFTLPMSSPTNLFVWAQDWTGVTANGNTTPLWWFYMYYGAAGLAMSDASSDDEGNPLVYDYTNDLVPYIATPTRLSYWNFDHTNTWVGDAGQMPMLATNLAGVPSFDTNAVLIDSATAASLVYRDVETSGNPNILLPKGSIRFWFKADWNSGDGPGTSGRLVELGDQTATNGWWALGFNPSGTQLTFGTQAGGLAMTNLSGAICWAANQWHQLVLNYSSTNSVLYVDAQVAATGLGSVYYPNAAERAQGLRIGSDATGNNQARGVFDELETFNYPLDPASILTSYQAAVSLDSSGDGLGNILANELGLNPYAAISLNGLNATNGLQVFTPLK